MHTASACLFFILRIKEFAWVITCLCFHASAQRSFAFSIVHDAEMASTQQGAPFRSRTSFKVTKPYLHRAGTARVQSVPMRSSVGPGDGAPPLRHTHCCAWWLPSKFTAPALVSSFEHSRILLDSLSIRCQVHNPPSWDTCTAHRYGSFSNT